MAKSKRQPPRSKKVSGHAGRFRDRTPLPAGLIPCPLCNTEMDVHIDVFTCRTAVDGPYAKVGVVLTCADNDRCRYRERVGGTSQKADIIGMVEEWGMALRGDVGQAVPGRWHVKRGMGRSRSVTLEQAIEAVLRKYVILRRRK
jgi:hypothetical protein